MPATAMMLTTGIAASAGGAVPGVGTTPDPGATASTERVDSTVKINANRHTMAGRKIKVSGQVRPAGRRTVTVKVGNRRVDTVRTDGNGNFRVRWTARRPGVYTAKAVVQGTDRAKRGRSSKRQINVYRASAASYYGPGFYGNSTACGKTLTPSTVGVANRSLPCGTKVTFRYRGKTVRARVIDRGPFHAGREWDLTAALKAKLGFGSTGTVLSTK